MKISYNAPAMRASNALNASDSRVSKSLERLSSGLKVTTSRIILRAMPSAQKCICR